MSRTDSKYLDQLRSRYRRASKKERTVILDEFVRTTGYHRKHAIGVLNGGRARKKGPIRRPRRKVYGPDVTAGLVILDDLFDHICSKLLRAAITAELSHLYEMRALCLTPECYQKLMAVSPATIERLLAEYRRQAERRRGGTEPGSLLKKQIPIRTWADWTEDRPGFCELRRLRLRAANVLRDSRDLPAEFQPEETLYSDSASAPVSWTKRTAEEPRGL